MILDIKTKGIILIRIEMNQQETWEEESQLCLYIKQLSFN